jgi:hypothetical protein
MRSTVLFAVVLVLNIGGGDAPGVLAGTDSPAAPQTTGLPSATQEVQPPDLQGFPTAPAPDELAAVALPDTISAVTALFERLSAEVAGHTRLPQFDRISPERVSVGYGEDRRIAGVRTSLLRLQAIELTMSDFFPTNWTGGQVVAYLARQGKEAMEAGRDGNLFWMRDETSTSMSGSTERFPVYGMVWGRVDSPWLFSVQADSRQSRDALLTAFVAAAKSARG